MKILLVGGTWDEDGGRPSGLINKLYNALVKIAAEENEITFYNGGNFNDLHNILDKTPKFNTVFWFANVDNTKEKIRDVKAIAPHTLLVTSKRNDISCNGEPKYDFEELIQRARKAKANLCFEFSKIEDSPLFTIRVFDPLGCFWYNGFDIEGAVKATYNRLSYLSSVTRKGSVSVGEMPKITFTKNDDEFLDFVKNSADTFHKLMMLPEHVDRFVGNASLRFKSPTRCMNGFPGMRKGDTVLISRRNVDKTGITFADFVPCYLEDSGEVAYFGDKKPSVDAPVQLRLFERLPNIDYILHGHCYAQYAPMTQIAVPCGAIEEIDVVMPCIEKHYGMDADFIAINLKGHGCLIMAGKNSLHKMKYMQFIARPIPEIMYIERI